MSRHEKKAQWSQPLAKLLRRTGFILSVAVLLSILLDRLFFQGHGFPPPHLKTKGLFSRSPARCGTWALLLNGAVRPRKNHFRYWNNVSLMYCSLRSMGWQNISVFSSDGTSTAPDRIRRSFLGMIGYGAPENSPADLDLDGKPDISGPATRFAFEQALGMIGRKMKPTDSLFIFITDHGTISPVNGRLKAVAALWDGKISGREFQEMLASHIPKSCWTAILATQCWSAMFLREVTRPNTMLIASGRPNWIWSSPDYSVFPQLFCEALLGKKVFTAEPVSADADGNGDVSFREAFRSARSRDHVPEWPVLWINGDPSAMPQIF
jgi:hypothetical protein